MRSNREKAIALSVAAVLLAALAIALGDGIFSARPVRAGGELTPQPIQLPGYPFPAAVIDKWVAADNVTAMRQHAWALWGGISAITPASFGFPVWETWYSDAEVQAGPPLQLANTMYAAARAGGRPARSFHLPRQFHHVRGLGMQLDRQVKAALPDPGAQVLAFNKFNTEYADFVWSNGYYAGAALWNIQAGWPAGTPVALRTIKQFPAPAIGLKPVFQFVNGPHHNGGITVVNYWLGDLVSGTKHSTNPGFPTPDTWTQCVVVYTGSGPLPLGQVCKVTGHTGPPILPTGRVSVNQFYNFQLQTDEVQSACSSFPAGKCPIQVGDYAILVAMHMTTKEDANWTWQTFWWNYNQPFPYGPPPSNVPAPFDNYAMCTGYATTFNPANNPAGQNVRCYNPYLETGLKPVEGVNSDCMTCHMVASLGNNPNDAPSQPNPTNDTGYPMFLKGTSTYMSVADATDDTIFFNCQTQTDFSWFLAGVVAGSANPPPQPPCIQAVKARKRNSPQ